MKHTVIYIDPEARPSEDLVGVFGDHGIGIKWITNHREIDLRRDTSEKHAIIVDLSSADPREYEQRIQEARSIDLTLPSVALVPPFNDSFMAMLVRRDIVHKFVERPFSEDDLAQIVIEMVESRASKVDAEAVPINIASLLKDGTASGTMDAEDIFGSMIADLEHPAEALPVDAIGSLDVGSSSTSHVANSQYQSIMRHDVTEIGQDAPAAEEYYHYTLMERIATGGMAEVFKAVQRGAKGFEKVVALKRILPAHADDEEFVSMFIDEARLAASMTHPNIVRILDFGQFKETYFLTMEYVDGKDLRWLIKRLRERGLKVPEAVATNIAMRIASALDYIHAKQYPDGRSMELVHRDISPQNIMISRFGTIGIVDFGVAKAAVKLNQTMAGSLKGKLVYMSPEQASGRELDGRSDIFSLGLVIHEMMTGKRCYSSKTEMQSIELARNAEVPPIADLNPAVTQGMENIVAKSTEKDIEYRYANALEMEHALKDHAESCLVRTEDSDMAEFLIAAMDRNPEVLLDLYRKRYPECLIDHSGGSLPNAYDHAQQKPQQAKDGDAAPEHGNDQKQARPPQGPGSSDAAGRGQSSEKTEKAAKAKWNGIPVALKWFLFVLAGFVLMLGMLIAGLEIGRRSVLKENQGVMSPIRP
jgi:serine/threonine protein kinase